MTQGKAHAGSCKGRYFLPSPLQRAAATCSLGMSFTSDEACYVCLFVLGILTRFVMLNHPRQARGIAPRTQEALTGAALT